MRKVSVRGGGGSAQKEKERRESCSVLHSVFQLNLPTYYRRSPGSIPRNEVKALEERCSWHLIQKGWSFVFEEDNFAPS